MQDRTHDGGTCRILTVIDEYTKECLALPTARRLRRDDVLAHLTDLTTRHGQPDHIRSDNGPEFVTTAVREWLAKVRVKKLYITPGMPLENGYNAIFNGKHRDELLNTKIFTTLLEAQILIERRRRHYNNERPHSTLGYRPPALETILISPDPPAYATSRTPH